MKHFVLAVLLTFITSFGCMAQALFHRIDITTGNIYSFVISNLLSAGVNYLTQDRLLDTSFGYTMFKTTCHSGQMKLKDFNRVGITACDLIADSSYGIKLGYQSTYPGIFNWGIYGSAHYKINQFDLTLNGSRTSEDIQRFQLGGGFLFAFGSIDSPGKAVVEIGLRYNLPAYYKGSLGNNAGALSRGLTNHYSLRFGGFGVLQGIGLFAEIPLYNIVKNTPLYPALSIKPFTCGVTYTIMPWE